MEQFLFVLHRRPPERRGNPARGGKLRVEIFVLFALSMSYRQHR
ncbi:MULTISPECIES: hypothetical protein [unclassified Methanosarcina]|nr:MULTISPECIES: hypothetical protein [unclassified Methanosarcina]